MTVSSMAWGFTLDSTLWILTIAPAKIRIIRIFPRRTWTRDLVRMKQEKHCLNPSENE